MEKHRQEMSPSHFFLTNFTLKTATVVFKVCTLLNAFPFALESKDSLRVRKHSSKFRIALWHLANLVVYFAATFEFTAYMHEVFTGEKGNAFAIHTIYGVVSLFGVVFMLTLYMKPDVGILMLNQHDKLLETIEGKQSIMLIVGLA